MHRSGRTLAFTATLFEQWNGVRPYKVVSYTSRRAEINIILVAVSSFLIIICIKLGKRSEALSEAVVLLIIITTDVIIQS